jgi:N4-gp56 family major capsid protein
MANETTTTTLNDLFSNIVAQARFTAEEESLMLGLVTQYNIAGQAGTTVQVPKYGALTASDVDEATDLTNAALNTGTTDIAVGEVGAMVTLTDMALHGAGNPASEVGTVLGNAIATKIDKDLMGLFKTEALPQVGTVGGALSVADIFAAVATLKANSARGQMYGVLHPNQAYALKSALTNSFANGQSDVGNEALRSGYIGNIAGVQMYESANVPVDYTDLGADGSVGGSGDNADTANQAAGAIFTAEGLAIAIKSTFNLETQRDASLRANELVASAVYGKKVLDALFAVRLCSKKTL